jgi:hypothetical protein
MAQLLSIHTLTKTAPVSPLDATLTKPSRKNIKTRDFNSFRIRSYSTPLCNNLIRNNLTKHGGRGEGVGGGAAEFRISCFEFRLVPASPDPIVGRRVMVDFASYETVKQDYRGNRRLGFLDAGGPLRSGPDSQRVLDFLQEVKWLQTCK